MKKGKLIIVSGFSGVGKGTVMEYLKNNYDNYEFSVSVTTRQPRENEINGVHYHFITNDKFEKMVNEDALLEYAGYVDHYYGTPRQFVEDNINQGKDVILEIETQGALQVKEKKPEAVMVYILPPSAKELKKRLVGRNTESIEVINDRLAKAAEETDNLDKYDYFVVNDKVETCAKNIDGIRNDDNPDLADKDFVEQIKKVLREENNMLHPSYSDLMAVANSEVEDGEQPVVQSRYSIVMATSKRARQLIAGDTPLIDNAEGKKPLSIAVDELYNSKIRILGEDEEEE